MDCCNDALEAMCNGHLDCLKRVHEIRRMWCPNTTYNAAMIGNIDCLIYIFMRMIASGVQIQRMLQHPMVI